MEDGRVKEIFYSLVGRLAYTVAGQPFAVLASVVGLLTGQNVLLIGPPGTAKSMLIRTLAALVGGKSYIVAFHESMTFDYILPIDLAAFKNESKIRRIGRLLDADLAFFDELFRGSDMLLNSLLSILNERVVYNEQTGEVIQLRLLTVFAATNFVSTAEKHRALLDRFTIRARADRLAGDMLASAVRTRWLGNSPIEPITTPDEIRAVQRYIMDSVPQFLPEYIKIMIPAVSGLSISNRWAVEFLPRTYTLFRLIGFTKAEAALLALRLIPGTGKEEEEVGGVIRSQFGELGDLMYLYIQARIMQMSPYTLPAAIGMLRTIAEKRDVVTQYQDAARAIQKRARNELVELEKRLKAVEVSNS